MYYVWELLDDIQEGITELQRLELQFQNSSKFAQYISNKEKDYIEFKKKACNFGTNNSIPELVNFLKAIKAESKYLGICKRGKAYFQITKKLVKEINAEAEEDPQIRFEL